MERVKTYFCQKEERFQNMKENNTKLGDEFCVLIPAYNNANSLLKVIEKAVHVARHVVVINDGSTDGSEEILKRRHDITILSLKENRGKGNALRKGFEIAQKKGFRYAVTLDADGQHNPLDIPNLVAKVQEHPDALIVGARDIQSSGMPAKNSFANKFSNFWYQVETGKKLPDTQSGFRLYPLRLMQNMRFYSGKYEFEVEVLVRLTWKRVSVFAVPVSVVYPPQEERVTHFRPFHDFSRISVLNTVLVLWALLYIYPRNGVYYLAHNKWTKIVKDQLYLHNDNPAKVAYALGFGVFMGIVPIWGFQMLVAIFLSHLLKLNKILVLVASNISLPPMIPFIIYFSYKTGGWLLGGEQNLASNTVETLKAQVLSGDFYKTIHELGYSILQYVVGSFAFAIAAGILVTLFTLFTLSVYKPQQTKI